MGTATNDNDDEVDESWISQFETTLTIRPTKDCAEDQDLSIDHTTLIYADKTESCSKQLSEFDERLLESITERYDNIPDTIPEPSLRLLKSLGVVKGETEEKDTLTDSELLQALQPSPLIDIELARFEAAFGDFIIANPQIKKESPRFDHSPDKTLVLLSPYSPEHAFGRKWVSKSYLSTIFERPQRLLASCIGISSALTMYPYFYRIKNSTKRGSLFSSHVQKIHGKSWPKQLFDLCLESHDKLRAGQIEVPDDWNTGDIYLTPKTITAIEGVLGTIETAIDSLFEHEDDKKNHNLAFVAIRPPGHHSHACLPSGFCMLNNAQIGIEYAFDSYGVTHCAILDIDLHHGDGSQDICWERAGFSGDHGKADEEFEDHDENPRNEYGKKYSNYPKVGYFSLHDIKSYPTELGFASKEHIKNASLCVMDHDLNLWNVHLQEWSTEDEFYKHYQTKYVAILNRANQFLNHSKKQYEQLYSAYLSDLAKYNKFLLKPNSYKQHVSKPTPPPPYKPLILISAGFDASEYENPQMQRHSVNVPTSFYAKFTEDVVKLAEIHTRGKVVSFLEGGYSDGALISGIFSHLIGFTNFNKDRTSDISLWNQSWGSEQVIKELTRGCKRTWTPYKNPRTETTIWANEVIKLGRSMMPNAILPADYVYDSPHSKNPEAHPNAYESARGSKMLRDIMDDKFIHENLEKISRDRQEKIDSRHTRSYYQKNAK